jgi:hypothetical protein
MSVTVSFPCGDGDDQACYGQMDRLFTMDTKAINHILVNSYDYWKPEGIRYTASRIFGRGTLYILMLHLSKSHQHAGLLIEEGLDIILH